MAVAQDSRKAYLIGGAGDGAFDPALYELDLQTDIWRRLATTGAAPPSFQGATLTFDQADHVLLLAGGLRHQGPGPATLSQVWIFDPATNQWDETDCGDPLRRRDHLGAYNPATGEHILIGGRVSTMVGNFYDRGTPVKMNVRIRVRRIPG
jgi:N-acetylneuraminic acid mutarotase